MSPPFAFEGFTGEAAPSLSAAEAAAAARRLIDPAAALETVHWGRNYLYRARLEAPPGPFDVVVKQFRNASAGARLRRRLSGDRAAKSFAAASALAAAGFETPEPLFAVRATEPGGPSFYVCRHLGGRTELRYLLRARNAGTEADLFPGVDVLAVLVAVARLARRLHEAGFWFRDFSVGNLLVDLEAARAGREPAIALVDTNRCRKLPAVSLGRRLRDLARLPLDRPTDREALLAAYFAPGAPAAGAATRYETARRAFHGRHRAKNRARSAGRKLKAWLVPRGVHAHIPKPPAEAGARDKIVWDRLSDQPHQHAGRLERLAVRAADLPSHAASLAAALGAAPRLARAYRQLAAGRNARPFPWPGCGVALRPDAERSAALLDAFDALGLRQALLRLHPWEADHDAEEALARELARRGVELTFALPQSRELVADRGRWRAAVEELARRFTPLGRAFQVGQAINRSKWGIWHHGEYLEIAAEAAAILRAARPDVVILGPAVIDFELHATAAVVNRRRPAVGFDALASLLYVDRRGAPENRQLGFDTIDKVTLLAAIAATGRQMRGAGSWVTEVNWPLAEGPHSPAGRSVAVSEERQADYLARFYLLALGTGLVDRVFWWQLAARGYGLADPLPGGALRRRPAFLALATLERILAGTLCHGPQASSEGVRLYRFVHPGRTETWVGWAPAGPRRVELPRAPVAALARDGAPLPAPGVEVEVAPSIRYFLLPAPG